jgi:hypothetical protein
MGTSMARSTAASNRVINAFDESVVDTSDRREALSLCRAVNARVIQRFRLVAHGVSQCDMGNAT